jgi:hypothetical protein
MKKIGYIFLGLILSAILSYAGIAVFLNPIIKETGQSPESLMGYAYLIIYPICLFFGSILSGYLLNATIEKNIKSYLKYSPGVYASIPYVIGILSAPMLSLFLAVSVAANIVLSTIGLYVGIKLGCRINTVTTKIKRKI